MDPDKTFCLKWNDFQQNVFSTIKNLRLDIDFLDVSLFCNAGKQVKAHKVILSACSNTFRAILKENPGPNPVIVLWDMEARDLSAILDFMYNGQVEIKQEDLESFLAAAGRLQVQGLSVDENGGSDSFKDPRGAERSRKRPPDVVRNCKPAKLVRRKSSVMIPGDDLEDESRGGDEMVVHDVTDKELIIHDVRVKEEEVEPEVITQHNHTSVVRSSSQEDIHSNTIMDPTIHPTNHQQVAHNVITSASDGRRDIQTHGGYIEPETVDYPVEDPGYEDYYEEDEAGYNSVQYPIDYSLDNSHGKVLIPGQLPGPAKSVKCPYCDKVLKYRHNLKGHIQNQHGAGEPEAPCPICPDKTFKNAASLRDHMSRKHKAEKQAMVVNQQNHQGVSQQE